MMLYSFRGWSTWKETHILIQVSSKVHFGCLFIASWEHRLGTLLVNIDVWTFFMSIVKRNVFNLWIFIWISGRGIEMFISWVYAVIVLVSKVWGGFCKMENPHASRICVYLCFLKRPPLAATVQTSSEGTTSNISHSVSYSKLSPQSTK